MWVIHRFLVETLFIPALRNFFNFLDCRTIQDTLSVEVEESIECWEGIHLLYAVFGVLMVLILYPTSLSSATNTSHKFYLYSAKYNVLWFMSQFMLVGTSTFLSQHPSWAIASAMCVIAGLFILNLRIQPCLGSGRHINHITASVFISPFWAGICGLTALGINNANNHIPIIMLCIGMPLLMYIAYRYSVIYEEKKDTAKILKLRTAASSTDVEFQRSASEQLATICKYLIICGCRIVLLPLSLSLSSLSLSLFSLCFYPLSLFHFSLSHFSLSIYIYIFIPQPHIPSFLPLVSPHSHTSQQPTHQQPSWMPAGSKSPRRSLTPSSVCSLTHTPMKWSVPTLHVRSRTSLRT